MINFSAPDLTQHPPRSVRVRIGGYAHLGRLIDKVRALQCGKNGPYDYNCVLDQQFFAFTGINADEMFAAITAAKSDSEILAWVRSHTKRGPSEIHAWSSWFEQYGPGDVEGHSWFGEVIQEIAAQRDDIRSFADLLDLDDFVSYGGKG